MLALVIGAGLLGLLIGSFLNVVIARVPAGGSLLRPGSTCPHCGTPIAPRDNVPVLAWLWLRGRARCCGAPISVRYPIVELLTAVGFGAAAAWCAGRAGTAAWPLGQRELWSPAGVLALLAMLYLVAVSIALAAIDIDTYRLPTVIVVPSWWVAGALLCGSALLAGRPGVAVRTLLGGLALWLFYRTLHAVYAAGMGYGDVRLAALMGGYLAWIGWDALLVGAFAGFLFGGLSGIVLVLAGRLGLKSGLPFGPYLLLGAWVGLVAGPAIAAGYLSISGLG